VPNNLILRRIEATPEWRPLSPVPLVGTVDLSAPPSNSGPVFLRAGPGEEVYLIPSEYHQLVRVALDSIEVRSDTPGNEITLIGGTW
jgi:hypothetical protein